MSQGRFQDWVVISVPASLLGFVVVFLLGCAIAMATAGAVLAQQKKDEKADDEKTKLNKALNTAASIGKLDQVKDLIKQGADPEWRDPAGNGKTAMVRAVMSGKVEVVKFLMENGADVHAPDGSGRYPVYFCCIGTNLEMLKFLLEKGCDKGRSPCSCRCAIMDRPRRSSSRSSSKRASVRTNSSRR